MTITEILAAHHAKHMDRMAKWENIVNDFPLFFEEMAKLGVEPRFNEDGCLDIRFAGDGELFRKVWVEIRSLGFKPSWRPGEKDRAEFGCFWHWNGDRDQHRYPKIWFNFCSTVCKAVKIGVKVVEEPIYAVQCGDGTTALGQTSLGELLGSENDNVLARE